MMIESMQILLTHIILPNVYAFSIDCQCYINSVVHEKGHIVFLADFVEFIRNRDELCCLTRLVSQLDNCDT